MMVRNGSINQGDGTRSRSAKWKWKKGSEKQRRKVKVGRIRKPTRDLKWGVYWEVEVGEFEVKTEV